MARYEYTDDRTGQAILACEGCGERWAEDLIEGGCCPDCRADRDG